MSKASEGKKCPWVSERNIKNPRLLWDNINEESLKIRNKKISDSKKGNKNPAKRPEVRKKISETQKGRNLSYSHKKNIGKGVKKRWDNIPKELKKDFFNHWDNISQESKLKFMSAPLHRQKPNI